MKTRREFIATIGAGIAAAGTARIGVAGTAGPATPSAARAALPSSRRKIDGTGFVYDPRSLAHVVPSRNGVARPEVKERLIRIMEVLGERGLLDEMEALDALADPMPYISAHHTPEHVASIREIEVSGPIAELAVAGALGAVAAVARGEVRNAFCAIRPPGHHANNTGAEEGFCYYSNAAIAARYAQRAHGFERVAIIDWDYHHGNATQNAFYDDPSVLFYSTHDREAYPQTGDPSLRGSGDGMGTNINIHLECGSTDADMLGAWDRELEPAIAAFDPDFIILSAGFDSRKDDLLGCFEVTDDAFRVMTRKAMEFADSCCEGRIVSLLEGGYNIDGLALATAAHVETLLGA